MKVEVRIKAAQKGDIQLAGAYPWKNKLRIWHDRVLVGEYPLTPKKDDPHPMSEDLFFTRDKDTHVFTYEVNAKGEPMSDTDKQIIKLIDTFFKNHPLCSVNGIPHVNTASPLFDITDKATETATRAVKWDRKRKIANYLAESDLQNLRDIMYYYGHTPAGKSHMEICLFLADYEVGILFVSNSEGQDSSKEFITTFVLDQNPDVKMAIHARKAIELKIIEARTVNGNVGYYHLGQYCGADTPEIVDYFKRNEKIYNDHVVRKIAERDSFVDETRMSEVEKTALSADVMKNTGELERFRFEVQGKVDELLSKGVNIGYTKKDKRVKAMGSEGLKALWDELLEKETTLTPA